MHAIDDVDKFLSESSFKRGVYMLFYEVETDNSRRNVSSNVGMDGEEVGMHKEETQTVRRSKRKTAPVDYAESDEGELAKVEAADSDGEFDVRSMEHNVDETARRNIDPEDMHEMASEVAVEISGADKSKVEEEARKRESSGRFRQKANVDATMSPARSSFIVKFESALHTLRGHLRLRPTLPHGMANEGDELDSGVHMPRKFCGFNNCEWHGDTSEDLKLHVTSAHADALGEVDWDNSLSYHGVESPQIKIQRQYAMYCGAIVLAEQSNVPCTGLSIDRRCRAAFLSMLNNENVCAMICLVCARVLPYEGNA